MGFVNLLSRPWFAVVLFGLLVLASRYPDAPGQLFTFDDVNLALSVGHFDVRISQPQPPGYPVFVLEMRMLHWLRFRRVESILLFLALAGSIAALVLLSEFGRRFFGGLAGFFAACLLVFHPVFWHAGIASALRVQLAVISLLAAWACWRAWSGERKWVLASAIVLGLSAGIRPEIGPLLFPLWAVCAWRAGVSAREWVRALAAMAGAVLLWLLPAMFASGGPAAYVRANLDYIADQASVSSGLFGALPVKWHTTFWRLIAWTCCGFLSCTLPAVLAWKRKEGWAAGRDKLAFLGLWLLPPFLFAILVHLEDPGQTLAMAPPIALFGGYLFNRALDNWSARTSRWETIALVVSGVVVYRLVEFQGAAIAVTAAYLFSRVLDKWSGRVSRWETVTLVAAGTTIYWVVEFRDTATAVIWVPVIALAAGLLLQFARVPGAGHLPRPAVAAFLLVPLAIVQSGLFNNHGWYYRGNSPSGLAAYGERVLEDLNSGLALTSLSHIKNTLALDDHSLRSAIRLAGERPGKTLVIWERGLVSWRKACYYMRSTPVVVLERNRIRSGAPPVVSIWNGASLGRRLQGPAPLSVTLPAGGRIVWLLDPRTEFYSLASANFPLAAAGPVYYTDLPAQSGSRILGEYRLEW
jgi:4-amino-4-deoxy-L-arabinose transferase-like glycosyltransferase